MPPTRLFRYARPADLHRQSYLILFAMNCVALISFGHILFFPCTFVFTLSLFIIRMCPYIGRHFAYTPFSVSLVFDSSSWLDH